MERYVYVGPVMVFGKCVESKYRRETYAVSEKKARSNVEYAWKQANGLAPSARVSMPGNIYILN